MASRASTLLINFVILSYLVHQLYLTVAFSKSLSHTSGKKYGDSTLHILAPHWSRSWVRVLPLLGVDWGFEGYGKVGIGVVGIIPVLIDENEKKYFCLLVLMDFSS